MQVRTTVHDERDEAQEAERLIRGELSHIADALGVAPYGGCYEQAEVLERAKALAKRVEELETLVLCSQNGYGRWSSELAEEAHKIAERRAGRAK